MPKSRSEWTLFEEEELERLDIILGVAPRSAEQILAKIGTDINPLFFVKQNYPEKSGIITNPRHEYFIFVSSAHAPSSNFRLRKREGVLDARDGQSSRQPFGHR
jgi:hypothetical protein